MLNIVHQIVFCVKTKIVAGVELSSLKSRQRMTVKDERIGFRISSEVKVSLRQIAKREGRSLAQICDLLLRGGIYEYDKGGSKYLNRFVALREKQKEKL
jgi:hypothetical protein